MVTEFWDSPLQGYFYLQGSKIRQARNQHEADGKQRVSNLKMETICSSETWVDFQRITGRYIPEDRTLHNHLCENLKSYKKSNSFSFVRLYFSVVYFTTLSAWRLHSTEY
jgi:hypothetical protein